MWTFDSPAYLLLLAAIPVLVLLRHFWKGRGGRMAMPLGLWNGPRLTFQPSFLRFLNFFSHVFFWLAFAGVIVALAGPNVTDRQKIYLNEGANIMLVLDDSPSMGARDFPPQSRFEAAKSVIEHFVKGRQNDEVGLVCFGTDAVLEVPLTTDRHFLLANLKERHLMELGDGTALGMGIAVATEHLEASANPNRVMIVLTDGDNNAGEIQPATAINLATSLGIRLYFIGIGTSGTVPLEVTDPKTGLSYFGTLEGGGQEAFLKNLATGPLSEYFSAKSTGSLGSIFQAIDAHQGLTQHTKIQVSNHPLYQEFLPLVLGLFLLSFVIRKLVLKEIL